MAATQSPTNERATAERSPEKTSASTVAASGTATRPAAKSKSWLPRVSTRWVVITLITAVMAVVLLFGLPLGAVWVVSNSGCCMASGPEYVITFWASMIAGFLALFGMVLTAVFIITALRTEQTARVQARRAADKAARTYVKRHKEGVLKEMDVARDCVTACSDSIIGQIQKRHTEARKKIDEAENETTKAAREAGDAIVAVRNQTTNAADEAQAAISAAGQAVERLRGDTMPAIDRARQEAEAAAKTLREQADRATGGPAPTEGGPERPDE